MTDPTRPCAVIGATGQQGGAVVAALLEADVPVRAVVRDPSTQASRALARRGVTLVGADQEDAGSLHDALTDVTALFLMTTFAGADGTDGEVRRGRTVAEAAARAAVPHVVYSSVGGAERHSAVPHFESKRLVEQRLAELVPAFFVRPTFFMDNFAGALAAPPGEEFVLQLPVPGEVPIQMVAVRDIGRVAATLLQQPELVQGDALEIAGDERSGEQIAAEIGAHLGVPSRFERLPLEALGDDGDQKAMFRWFAETPAYDADFATTRRVEPDVLTLQSWLRSRKGS